MAARGLRIDEQGKARCAWSGADPLYSRYHDDEWGLPVADDRRLFEKLCLEGFQSGPQLADDPAQARGLPAAPSRTSSRRRWRASTPGEVERLLADAGIVRHRGKIESAINNARARARAARASAARSPPTSGASSPRPRARPAHTRASLTAHPTTAESIALSKELKRRGFSFVGPTTVYAFMQAMGLVNDHLGGLRAAARRSSGRAHSSRAQASQLA